MSQHPTPASSDGSLYRLEITTDAPELVSSILIDANYLQGTEIVDEDDASPRLVSYVRSAHAPSTVQVRAELDELLDSLQDVDWELETFEAQESESWQSSWKESFEPTSLSPRLVVQPPWSNLPPRSDGTVLTINPGMAFGTGHHATTRVAAELLDARLDQFEGTPSLLDVGCGSGILSMAAFELGADPVEGLDIDREILDIARSNLERNALTDHIDLSLRAVGDLETTYDIVVANIRSRILRELRDELLERTTPGGILILSGVMVEQRKDFVEDFLSPLPETWRVIRELERENWVGFELERRE